MLSPPIRSTGAWPGLRLRISCTSTGLMCRRVGAGVGPDRLELEREPQEAGRDAPAAVAVPPAARSSDRRRARGSEPALARDGAADRPSARRAAPPPARRPAAPTTTTRPARHARATSNRRDPIASRAAPSLSRSPAPLRSRHRLFGVAEPHRPHTQLPGGLAVDLDVVDQQRRARRRRRAAPASARRSAARACARPRTPSRRRRRRSRRPGSIARQRCSHSRTLLVQMASR